MSNGGLSQEDIDRLLAGGEAPTTEPQPQVEQQDSADLPPVEEPADVPSAQVQTQPPADSVVADEPEPPHIPTVRQVRFTPFPEAPQTSATNPIDLILDVSLEVTVELGRARKPISEILQLGPGAVIELDKLAGEPVDVLVNGKLVAHGEVVVIDENFGVRITEILSPADRARSLS